MRRVHSVAAVACVIAAALSGCGDRVQGHADRVGGPEGTLFLAGMGEMWEVDVASGSVEHVRLPELGAGDPPHLIAAVGDRLALWNYDVTTVPMKDPSAPPQTLARDAWIFIPAANPDRLWVGFLDPDSPATERGLGELREIDSRGDVVTRGVTPPDGAWPYAEVGGALLFQAPKPTLWDPVSGRTLRTWDWDQIGDMGPVSRNLLASDIYKTGELVLTDVTTGQQQRIAPPRGMALLGYDGTFSPDGGTLALPVKQAGDPEADLDLALVDVKTGGIELVPGSRVPTGYVFTAWSSDGDAVFMTGGERFHPRVLVSYRLGDERANTLDVDVGDFYDIAAR